MAYLLQLLFAFIAVSSISSVFADYVKVSHRGDAVHPGTALGNNPDDWACVYDTDTQLLWEVKTTDAGLHDIKWNYTWFNSDVAQSGGVAGTSNGGQCWDQLHCDTEKFVQQVNAIGFCGASDWRLPTASELQSILTNASGSIADIFNEVYPDDRTQGFWSATLNSTNANQVRINVLGKRYSSAMLSTADKSARHASRLVRKTAALNQINFKNSLYEFASAFSVTAPKYLTVAANGSLWVSDTLNHQVVNYSPSGKRLSAIGSLGTRQGQFNMPGTVVVANDNTLWVLDTGNHRLQQFMQDGTFLRRFGSVGAMNGQFDKLVSFALAPDGSVFVLDLLTTAPSSVDAIVLGNMFRIQHFTAEGSFIQKFNYGSYFLGPYGAIETLVKLIVAKDNSLYLLEHITHIGTGTTESHAILHTQADGTIINSNLLCCANFAGLGSYGYGLTLSSENNLVVTEDAPLNSVEHKSSQISVFTTDYSVIGNILYAFNQPGDIAYAPDHSIFVVDTQKNRIVKLVPQNTEYAYDSASGIAVFENVKVAKQHYWVKLQDQGGLQFKVLSAVPFLHGNDTDAASYDASSGLLIIPKVMVEGINYQVELQRQETGLFSVKSAIP